MTPEFASPEQLQGRPCTVASDIYSLGVILYQLLTGKRPYGVEASTPAEMLAAVATREPARPSIAAPEQQRAALRGDLDGIVMKALAKKPDDRYGSAEQLSDDIRCHLEGLPVSAVEGTRHYIARKFVGRHNVGVAAAAVVLLSLISGLAGTLWQARRAERQRVLAEEHFSDARKLANYLLFSLYDSVQSLPGSVPVRADMADQSLLYLDRLAAAKSADPALNLEIAEGYLRLGGILESPYRFGDSLGDNANALESDRKALGLLEPLAQSRPDDRRVQQDLARACINLAPVLNLSGRKDEAAMRMKQATAILDRLAALNSRDASVQVEAGRAWGVAMDVLSSQGGGIGDAAKSDQVMAAGDKAVAYLKAALALAPNDGDAMRAMAYVYHSQGGVLFNSKDFQQAIAKYQEGLDCLRRLPQPTLDLPENRGMEARLETMVGESYGELTQYPQSLAMLKSAQLTLDELSAEDPGNATPAFRRMNLYRARAYVNQNAGHTKDAIADYRVAIQIADVHVSSLSRENSRP